MPNEPHDLNDLAKFLRGIDFTLPSDWAGPPKMESTEEPVKEINNSDRRVLLQKIVTEIWVYTDVENKSFGQKSFQDIHILGEMSYEQALKTIQERKQRRRPKTDG